MHFLTPLYNLFTYAAATAIEKRIYKCTCHAGAPITACWYATGIRQDMIQDTSKSRTDRGCGMLSLDAGPVRQLWYSAGRGGREELGAPSQSAKVFSKASSSSMRKRSSASSALQAKATMQVYKLASPFGVCSSLALACNMVMPCFTILTTGQAEYAVELSLV